MTDLVGVGLALVGFALVAIVAACSSGSGSSAGVSEVGDVMHSESASVGRSYIPSVWMRKALTGGLVYPVRTEVPCRGSAWLRERDPLLPQLLSPDPSRSRRSPRQPKSFSPGQVGSRRQGRIE